MLADYLPELNSLSDRERQVVDLMLRGFDSEEIAQYLGISRKTVFSFRYRVHEKIGLRGDAAIILLAAERMDAEIAMLKARASGENNLVRLRISRGVDWYAGCVGLEFDAYDLGTVYVCATDYETGGKCRYIGKGDADVVIARAA